MNAFLSLLRENRNYRATWMGQVVSEIGDHFNNIAVFSLAVATTKSGLVVSGVMLSRAIPGMLIGPAAGVVLDRFDRKRVMIASDLVRAVIALAFIPASHMQATWPLYVLSGLLMVASPFFSSGRSAILPAIATAILGLHLLLVQRHGMSVPPSVEERTQRERSALRTIPFLPHFLLRDLFAWTAVLAVMAGLATFYPWELGTKADAFAPAPAGIRPEWYFLWAFEALKHVPPDVAGIDGESLAVVVMGLGAAGVLALPLVVGHTARGRRVMVWLALCALVGMLALTGLALMGGAG